MQQQTIETLRQALQESALPFAQQEPLASHTTFKIGGPAVFWCTPKNADQLRRTLALCRANGVRTYLLGNGSNTLFAVKADAALGAGYHLPVLVHQAQLDCRAPDVNA